MRNKALQIAVALLFGLLLHTQAVNATCTQVQNLAFGITVAATTMDTADNPTTAAGGGGTWNTPTSGNMLVMIQGVNKSSGGINVPSGWTRAGTDVDGVSVSGAAFYKVSDGTESTITTTWTTSDLSDMWIGEYSSFDTFDEGAQNDSGNTSVTSLSSGTTLATAEADSCVIAGFSFDTADNWVTGGISYTNSFTEIMAYVGAGGGAPGVAIAELDTSVTGTQETTASADTGPGDQTLGFILAFNNSGGGPTQSPVPVIIQQH